MKDFMGNELRVGDTVAYIQSYSNSPDLSLGEVIGIAGSFAKLKDKYDRELRKSGSKLVRLVEATV